MEVERHRSNEKPKIDSKYLKKIGGSTVVEVDKARSNKKSKNNNSSNY